jgi:hypothetical protein
VGGRVEKIGWRWVTENYICTGLALPSVKMRPHLYRVVASPDINMRPTHFYRSEPPPNINVPSRGRVRASTSPPGTNALICRGENTRSKWEISPWTNAWFSSSGHSTVLDPALTQHGWRASGQVGLAAPPSQHESLLVIVHHRGLEVGWLSGSALMNIKVIKSKKYIFHLRGCLDPWVTRD